MSPKYCSMFTDTKERLTDTESPGHRMYCAISALTWNPFLHQPRKKTGLRRTRSMTWRNSYHVCVECHFVDTLTSFCNSSKLVAA